MAKILVKGDITEVDGFMCGVEFVNNDALIIVDCGDGWALLKHGGCEEDKTLKIVGGELYFERDGVEIPV